MDNGLYIVAYPDGGSGQFIRTMIIYMLSGESTDVDFSDGSSHAFSTKYERTTDCGVYMYAIAIVKNFRPSLLTSLKKVVSADTPVVLGVVSAHPLLESPELCAEVFPEFKLLHIDCEESDFPTITLNHYFKQLYYRRSQEKTIVERYNQRHTEQVSNSNEIPLEILKQLVGEFSHEIDIVYASMTKSRLAAWPEKYKNKIYTINFADIIQNPEKVQTVLENITGVKMTDSAKKQYDSYVQNQMAFRKKYGIG